MKKYLIIIEKTDSGYSAYVPDLPGCIATGTTKTEVEKNIYEGIEFHIEGMTKDNLPIPENTTEAEILVFRTLEETH
ncbi:MAG: type II toxin-antitoxin system HicB family antitoxin [Verrucomicrobia bacterium]|nr:type II toxin-antitoxin system HicB family antitoxin [Cytophagales bacterium]